MGLLARYLPPADIDPADISLMRRVAGVMYIGGAASSLMGVFNVQATAEGRLSQSILTAVLICAGVAVLIAPSRPWLFRGAVLVAVTVISAMMATADPISATEFFYLWPIVFSAYFLGRRWTLIALLWLAATLAVALWGVFLTTDDIVKNDVYTSTLLTVGLIGALVALMRERERRLARGLERAARTDALTGLLNRHGLEPELGRLVRASRRTGVPLAIALFDLDHFKWFNDAHGHLAGDEALRRVGAVLRASVRAGDCVARFGGEEFAVILPGATPEGGKAFADRVAIALAAEDVVDELRLTASCGVAPLGVDDPVDVVLARADEALYAAKDAGRSRTAWWVGARLHVGAPLGDAEMQARRNAARAPREYVVRIADRAREIEPEPAPGADGPERRSA